jgi:phytoene synthase
MSDDPQTLFKRKSRSFSLAARFFSPDTQEAIARLYQFCRYVDDLADETAHGEPERRGRLRAKLSDDPMQSDDPILKDFLELAQTHRLPLHAAAELVDASKEDCGPRNIQTEAELIRFAYGVAGTVGLLMQELLGARDAGAAPFAIDLGIALQLTNVVRDVAEDAARDRYYLPAQLATPEDIERALKTAEPIALQKVDAAVERVLQIADRYYASALAGHWYIPPRNRRAVFFALSFYRAIGTKLRHSESGAWRSRTQLGLFSKIRVGLAAYPNYRTLKAEAWSTKAPPLHESVLHTVLQEVNP